jgi:hypothetical protein
MKLSNILFASLLFPIASLAQPSPDASLYGFGQWNADSLGNHRVVVKVEKKATAVIADMEWRRHDANPEEKDIVVIDAQTGAKINNVYRIAVNREKGVIAFEPATVPGDYYIYYMRYRSSGSRNYPTVKYPPFVNGASAQWLSRNKFGSKKATNLPLAKVVQYQAINSLNSFYPMEIIATAKEKDNLLRQHQEEQYILFIEDRLYPIRMTTDLPAKWITDNRHDMFEGTAQKGEYYTFQFGLWAARHALNHIKLTFGDFVDESTGAMLPSSSFTCFNTGGTDVTGTLFEKDCSVEQGKVQALWIGTMIPEKQPAGKYVGMATVTADGAETKTVKVSITVSDTLIANHGDNEPWRHSRLRWLNSQIGEDDEVVAPYIPLEMTGNKISLLGREVTFSATGFPAQIESYFKETMTALGTQAKPMLLSPMELKADGGSWQNVDFAMTKHKTATIGWHAINENDMFLMNLDGNIESDGNMEYKVELIAKRDGDIGDIALQTHLMPGIAKYMLGLGQMGNYCPKELQWKWAVEKNQDAVWVGDVNAGLQLRFYDNQYVRPLNTNFYQQQPLHMPHSWYNDGKGGLQLNSDNEGTLINAYSGTRQIKKGDRLYYYFNVLITPFRTINTNKQWNDRYYHAYDSIAKIHNYGATVINIHHATPINPFINYPFLRPAQMKAYIDDAHQLGMKVKIYNTVRELSNSCAELFALRSLGGEIFASGKGGGFSWLQEHLDQNYIAAWFVPELKDAAIVNSGVSRWHNYYMEGLDWLVKNVGIDGLYIDDLAFDRMSMKRVRKILTRTNPGALIDLHSANQFNPRDGFANSANLYMEHFPYLDRLWFGEYFDYSKSPAYWLTEVSGIPFGLMGEMLQDGGNKWRGMVYGMTCRNPWSGMDNRPLWHEWEHFGLKDSEMIGYWVSDNPVQTGSDKTLATIYRHRGKRTLIALATWEDGDAHIHLTIDWKALGLNPKKATLHAPAIENYQPEKTWKIGEDIVVPKGQGWLIEVE